MKPDGLIYRLWMATVAWGLFLGMLTSFFGLGFGLTNAIEVGLEINNDAEDYCGSNNHSVEKRSQKYYCVGYDENGTPVKRPIRWNNGFHPAEGVWL